MRKLLATDFSIWPTAVSTKPIISDAIYRSHEHWASLANYLLLYGQIIIPTGNFLIIPALRMMLGEDVFDELVQTNVISFVRYDHWICYVGNGGGLSFFQVLDNEEDEAKKIRRWSTSFFKKKDESIDIMLEHANQECLKRGRSFIHNTLLDKTADIDFTDIKTGLRDETYNDIRNSIYLRRLFLKHTNRTVNLNNLPGINENQIRFLSLHTPDIDENEGDEISSLLRIATENFILGMGSFANVTDIVSDNDTYNVIKAKGQRFGSSIHGRNAFSEIQRISGVPDIGLSFAKHKLSAKTLLNIRELPAAQNFRNWLGNIDRRATKQEITERYMDAISGGCKIDSFKTKAFKFVVTKLWESIEPISGNIASAAEAFLFDKLYPNKCPDLFLKKVKSIIVEPTVPPPIKKRQSRNGPCPCKSGKKYKKCCGKKR